MCSQAGKCPLLLASLDRSSRSYLLHCPLAQLWDEDKGADIGVIWPPRLSPQALSDSQSEEDEE